MKKFLLLLFVSLVASLAIWTGCHAQTTQLSFTPIDPTQPDLNRPGGGANEWSYGQNIVNIPVQGVNTPRLDRYWRFTWLDFQPFNSPSTTYDFTIFDQKIQQSITNGQKFSFGVMQQCGGCDLNLQGNVSGNVMLYPLWLHTLMQGESPQDFTSGGEWFPNYNSPSYLTALKNLNTQINAHILAGSFNGVAYKNMIGQIDVRGYGDFGEWTNNVFNVGNITVATGDSIISYHVHVFNTFQCVNMVAAFDGGQLPNTNVPPGVGQYAMSVRNAVGPLGWRRDSWGQTDNYLAQWTNANPTVFGGYHFADTIMARFKQAPIVGEPQDGGSAGNFPALPGQMTQFGVMSFGNGNFNNAINATIQNNFRAASKAAGYRLILGATGATITTSPTAGGSFQIVLPWQNLGASPTYENWNVVFRLKNANTVLWTGTSSFNPRLFLPSGSATTITDNFTLSSVPAGTGYTLTMSVQDPNGYRLPMPLFITIPQNADGSYTIATGIAVTASGAVSNAGANQTISISSVNLSGSLSTGAATFLWKRISGPNTPTITPNNTVNTTITGLITGTYVFELDINGLTSGNGISQVTVIVNAPTLQANAGNNQTITLPTSTATLNGSGSTGTITTYSWTNVSGPNTPTITSASTVSTGVTGLIAGTYVFQLSVNSGASTSQVQVKVLPAPVGIANAGPDQTISIPGTTSVTLNGSGSSGTLTSFTWLFVSGPSTPSIASPATVTTLVTALNTIGTYIFTLGVNGGSIDTVRVIVNPPPAPASPGVNVFTTQVSKNGLTWNDGVQGGTHGIETGMKFRSSIAGYITGMRFLKAKGDTGTHIGILYSRTGTELARATFGAETLSGWQSVSFVGGVTITANTTYVVALFSPLGNYEDDNNYFTTAVVNTPLSGLADGTDGNNGVYIYTDSPAFPTNSFQKTNYWRDPIFSLTPQNTSTKRKSQFTFYINQP